MKNKTKAMWIELVGGIFGWIWIGSFFGSIYFLIQAALYDGSWLNLAAVLFAGVISKAVLRESEARKSLLMTHESVNFDSNSKFDNVDDKKCHKEIEKIVQQYGEFLQHSSPATGCVADQEKLPFPKGTIKNALINALKNTEDNHQKEVLKFAYLSLVNWQPDVGDSNHGIDLTDVDPMLVNPDEFLASLESTKDWSQIIQKEEMELRAELKQFDL